MITTTSRRSSSRRPRRVAPRALAGTLAVAILMSTALLGTPVAGASVHAAVPEGDPYVPPSVTVETPSTDDCAQRTQPPPPVDTSEDVPPGSPAPTPLPVPTNPVGGAKLGQCGLIVPDGAPPLPSDISAGAWLIADLDTGEVLAAKDPHGRYRPASTLKLLTVQPLLKNLKNFDQVVEGTENDAGQDGTRVGMEAGGKYTVKQLLTYLIIKSGNDAANALARVNGGYDKTVAEMNATAASLGALDTRAATVSGLDGPGQQTSAYDLALFAKADMATPPFPEIVSSVDVRVPAVDGEGYLAANDNQLLYQYKGALGGKTGFTDDARNTYVGMAAQNGRRLVVTMMNGNHEPRRQWMQGASLLDWGFALPAGTAAVGKLVGSAAEATAVPAQPTASTGVPSSSSAGSGQAAAGSGGATGGPTTAVAATENTSSSSGVPTAFVLAGIGLLVVAIGVVLLLRRRHLNKRPTFAGDAKPAEGAPTEGGAEGEVVEGAATGGVAETGDAAEGAAEDGVASDGAAGDVAEGAAGDTSEAAVVPTEPADTPAEPANPEPPTSAGPTDAAKPKPPG